MQSTKKYTDRLAAMEKPMDHEDIIDKVLQGLDYEVYKSVIDTVNARDSLISFEELHEKLITMEDVVANTSPPTQFPATVYVTQYRKSISKLSFTSIASLPRSPSFSSAKPRWPFMGNCQ